MDAVTRDVGGGRQGGSATTRLVDVRVGDRIKYHGKYGPREGEVIEIRDHLLMVRRFTEAFTWGSRSGGVRPIRRDRVIEIVNPKL
jgi:hypothetical protein